jgi:RNA polymerase sigma-70 factor (ECF subfamily)
MDPSENQMIEQVVRQVLGGKPDAFLWIVRSEGPGLRAFLASRLHQMQDVDDLAQEVFIIAYRKLPEFEPGRDFGVWLRGIARNKLKQHFERITRQASSLELFRREVMEIDRMAEEFESLAERTRSAQMMAMVQCIAKLPERMRMVVRGRMDGEKAAALSAESGLSLDAIYQIQHRSLDWLRDCIGKELAHAAE